MVDGFSVVIDDVVAEAGEQSGFQAGGAQDGLLGQGGSLQGEEFLGVGGLVDVNEIGAEAGDFGGVLNAGDGEGDRGEAVADGVLGRAGFAGGRFGSGGASGVGAVGGLSAVGGGFAGHGGLSNQIGHRYTPMDTDKTEWTGGLVEA